MIDRETIEDLIKMMVEHELVELDVADGDQSITLRRAEPHGAAPMYATPAPAPAAPPSASPSNPSASPSTSAAGGAPAESDRITINSPMVGTFYSKPNPDADSFVGAGSKVSDSTVVCLIEAMKVFNEIKAEMKGVITEVLVEDGDPVEYNQPLFVIDPA
ncbi:MAG: acetyl-CoA carboxylase biotin carboxyl carrier protein [Phycisphaerales bacterium]